jgi:hypothetical protein
MSQLNTTLPAPVLEAMAEAAYSATKTPSFPAWDVITPGYRSDMHRSICAAIATLEAAGYRVVGPQ